MLIYIFVSLYSALTVISGVKRNANKTSWNISKVLAIIRTGSATENITRHADSLTMHWCKIAHLLDKSHNMIYTNTAQTKYWFCALYLLYQYFKLAFELSFTAWQKTKKALACQSTDRAHWSNGIDERSKCKHATITPASHCKRKQGVSRSLQKPHIRTFILTFTFYIYI